MIWLLILSPILFVLGILTRDANMDPISTRLGVAAAYLGVLIFLAFVIMNGVAELMGT